MSLRQGDRKQHVGIGTTGSQTLCPLFDCWSATGICTWPLIIYSLYSPLSPLAKRFRIQLQQYTDDTQPHIALSHTDQSGKLNLEECLSSMHAWLCFSALAINPNKSEANFLVHVGACVLALCLLALTLQALLCQYQICLLSENT